MWSLTTSPCIHLVFCRYPDVCFLDVSEFSVRTWGQPNAFITLLHTITPNRIRGSWHIYLHLVDFLMVNVPLDPKTHGKTCRCYTPKIWVIFFTPKNFRMIHVGFPCWLVPLEVPAPPEQEVPKHHDWRSLWQTDSPTPRIFFVQ